MKNTLKLGVLVIFLFVSVFMFLPSHTQAVILTSENEKTEGASTPRALYLRNCARCHGADGKSRTETGRLLDAPDLTTREMKDLSDRRITRVITRGLGEMPGFGKKLKAKDVASLVSYTRSL